MIRQGSLPHKGAISVPAHPNAPELAGGAVLMRFPRLRTHDKRTKLVRPVKVRRKLVRPMGPCKFLIKG